MSQRLQIKTKKQKIHDFLNHEGVLVSTQRLDAFVQQVLVKAGIEIDMAVITADILTETDIQGVHSHGVRLLSDYLHKIETGEIKANAKPDLRMLNSTAVIDADFTLGSVMAHDSMQKAIELARANGIGMTYAYNACHFGAAGYYARMAAKQGFIGLVMSNTNSFVSVFGGKDRFMGTNPIAWAIPACWQDQEIIITSDYATAPLAVNKIRELASRGKEIPYGVLKDENGDITLDSHVVDRDAKGSIAYEVFGDYGYKMSNLAIFIELLLAILGGRCSLEITDLSTKGAQTSVSQAFIAIDFKQISALVDSKIDNLDRMGWLLQIIKDSPEALYPGELEFLHAQKERERVKLFNSTLQALQQIASHLGLEADLVD